ncbi:MAG: pyridoxal phosphate-dependent aminotransferase [Candidatus Diapherotrites archaeon]|nr:pyridoxal phosphate-dependent aminotransferase [Candidatus Diapherotrites archaeon]
MLAIAVARYMEEAEKESSWIRRMFEQGLKLKQEYGAENVADFSIGNPDLEPPPEFIEALKKHASDKGIHRYMPNAGFVDVRAKVAAWLRKEYKIDFGYEHVTMTIGAAGAMNIVLKTILNRGEEVIIFEPYFCEYKFYVENHYGKPVVVKTTDNFEFDFDSLNEKINKKTRAIIVNSPNNPTGKVYSDRELKKLSKFLEEKQNELGSTIYVLSDEPYREIVFDCKSQSITSFYNNSFMVYSWSKSLGVAGERIGYVATNPEIDDKRIFEKLAFSTRILGFVNAPALLQKAVADVLGIKVDVNIYKKRKEIISKGLRKAGYEFFEPQGTFYFFPKSPIPDELEFIRKASEKLVLLTPGIGFGRKGHFRISYTVGERTIELGLERMQELINGV